MITSLLALPLQFINASSSEYGNEKIDQLLFDIVEDYKEAIKGNITIVYAKFFFLSLRKCLQKKSMIIIKILIICCPFT